MVSQWTTIHSDQEAVLSLEKVKDGHLSMVETRLSTKQPRVMTIIILVCKNISCVKYFVHLIFVLASRHENILTPKISQITVFSMH